VDSKLNQIEASNNLFNTWPDKQRGKGGIKFYISAWLREKRGHLMRRSENTYGITQSAVVTAHLYAPEKHNTALT